MGLLWGIIGILLICILLLIIKISTLRKSADEIAEGFRRSLATDTNTLIDISSRDRHMRKLAGELNVQLRLLRKQRNQYLNGDRELKDAITNISHDLRTPLTAICGYLELLDREDQSENTRRYLSIIAERTEAMKTLTEELFRYSVIASTVDDLVLEPVNISATLEEAIAAQYINLCKAGITPVIQMPDAAIVRNLNRDGLARVLSNLITNAVRYSDGDLSIVLTEEGRISLSNTASKLDEVQVGQLFDRFYTVESARSSTGLGLSIAKVLTEHMGGRIYASYEGKRLTITIDFR